MENVIRIVSSIVIGISIIITALILKPAIQDIEVETQPSSTEEHENQILNLEEASNILNIEEEELIELISKDYMGKIKRPSLGSYQYIPSMKINDQYIFLKSEIYQWVAYHSGRATQTYSN